MDKIEKIRQEIKRLRKEIKDNKDPFAPNQKAGYLFALADMESFLNTLSEESGVDVTDFCKPIDPGIAQCVADHWWEMLDEEHSESLEEAAKEYRRESYRKSVMPNIDGPIPEYGGNVKDSFIAGAEWQKTQMMKEAVEGVVMDFSSNRPRPQVDVLLDPHKYHTDDKVRIIIVKEEV